MGSRVTLAGVCPTGGKNTRTRRSSIYTPTFSAVTCPYTPSSELDRKMTDEKLPDRRNKNNIHASVGRATYLPHLSWTANHLIQSSSTQEDGGANNERGLQHKHDVLQSKPAISTEQKRKNVRVLLTCWTSIPRASKSVVISTREEPERNSRMITSRSPWPMSPCMHEMVKSRSCTTRGASEILQPNGQGERALRIGTAHVVRSVANQNSLRINTHIRSTGCGSTP